MNSSPPDGLAFAHGAYAYRNGSGSATVHVPRDRAASDIAASLAALEREEVMASGGEQRQKVSEAA